MEYRFITEHAKTLISAKKEYQAYVQTIKQALSFSKKKNEIGQPWGDEDVPLLTAPVDTREVDDNLEEILAMPLEMHADEDSEFMLINRNPAYLKESAIAYMESQQDMALVNRLEPDLWQEYDGGSWVNALTGKKIKRALKSKARKKNEQQAMFGGAYNPDIAHDLSLSWPIGRSDFWISSFFGRRKHKGVWGFHYGIDMAAVKGTPVHAACAGTVIEAGRNNGYGNTIVIAHSKKYRTRYAHLQAIMVRKGQKVQRGALIGKVGDTGFVRKRGNDASHLHFELYAFGKQINPIYFLQ